ncbi:UNVERIFIED_ORG: hypothetical protein M2328_006353 [Rhodococcus erythropolis]
MNETSTIRFGRMHRSAPNWITAEQASRPNPEAAELEARVTEFWNTNPDIN